MQGGRNAFHMCAECGHLAVAQYLAPRMEDHLFDNDDNESTALHWAASKDQFSIVEYLVKSCGFDGNARNEVGLEIIVCCIDFSDNQGICTVDNCTYCVILCNSQRHIVSCIVKSTVVILIPCSVYFH